MRRKENGVPLGPWSGRSNSSGSEKARTSRIVMPCYCTVLLFSCCITTHRSHPPEEGSCRASNRGSGSLCCLRFRNTPDALHAFTSPCTPPFEASGFGAVVRDPILLLTKNTKTQKNTHTHTHTHTHKHTRKIIVSAKVCATMRNTYISSGW